MCDYSLEACRSRDAVTGDELISGSIKIEKVLPLPADKPAHRAEQVMDTQTEQPASVLGVA